MITDTKKMIAYCEAHSTSPPVVLRELERETHLKTLAPQMLSGHLQGQLLSLISKMLRPRAILEIGTFTGYAAICLAQGLSPDGILHTIEANRELEYIIREYINKAGLKNKIRLHIGQAREVVPLLDTTFDLVFLDADKHDYSLYYDLVFDKVNPGGLIMADNVLWRGKVVEEKPDQDARTIHAFNEKVQNDERVENLLLPVRDGLMVARKF